MEPASVLDESVVDLGESPVAVPCLLVELRPWHEVFFGNLGDLFWTAEQPRLRIASKPGDFWADVFVPPHLPWRRFADSGIGHAVFAVMIWGATLLWARRPQIVEHTVFDRSEVVYYSPAEYLPPLDTGGAHAQLPKKGEPELAPQPIISVPPEADNHTQTIVTPPQVKLNQDVPLPNVVAWSQTPLAVPIAATARSMADVKAPTLNVPVVAPPPDVARTTSHPAPRLTQDVVAPAPSVETMSARRAGDINIGHSEAVAPAPRLPVEEQRSRVSLAGLRSSEPTVVPPPPSVQGSAVFNGGGRLIALGIHPVAPGSAVNPPAGNRRGSFAATPQGKAGAAGTPDVATGHGSANGPGSSNRSELPSGLLVGQGPNSANHSAVAGNGQGKGPGGGTAPSTNPILMANATPPRVTIPPRSPAADETADDRRTEAEKEVFGDRKIYSMRLNMPNLNSGGGSWVIRFAERNENQDAGKGELSTPTAIAVADPAYPLELMRQNVKGTVTLYAVIRSDGSVSNVRVLNSVDDRLDQYACDALARWHFRPATKNGNPIDLEAVIMIPFKPGRMRSGF